MSKRKDAAIISQYEKRLLQKILPAFKWEGVDLDTRIFDWELFRTGGAGIFKDPDAGYVTMIGGDGGSPTPIGYGELFVGTDISGKIKYNKKAFWNSKISNKEECECVICFNDTFSQGVMDIIKRYAVMLQTADKSIEIALLNSRIMPMIGVSTENAKNQVQAVLNKMYDGGLHAFYDESLMGSMSENPLNELFSNIRLQTNLSELVETRADIYSRFCIEIGIPVVNNTKRSQLISGEIGGISTLSLVNLRDMLDRRLEFCDRFNELFGENLTVKIADEFLIETEAESEDMSEGGSEDSSEGTIDDSSEGEKEGEDDEL